MKKILLLLFCCAILWGCSKKTENKAEDLSSKLKVDTTELKSTPIDNANINFALQFKFKKGTTYHY
ncbi:MAG: hypothetical protein P4L45_02665, partial [Ignavibacteriaceae bacterium]|nr:hypothetical protein [Ignavibacteriaceae bacterium]